MTSKYLEDNYVEYIFSWLYFPYQPISHFLVYYMHFSHGPAGQLGTDCCEA